jgi:hypothetical protein
MKSWLYILPLMSLASLAEPAKPAAPVTKPATTAKPAAPPVAKPVAPPVAKPVAPPVAKPVTPPVAKPVAPPVAKPVAPPVVKPATPPPAKWPGKTTPAAPVTPPPVTPPPVAKPAAPAGPPPVAVPSTPWGLGTAGLRAWVTITEPASSPVAGVLALLPDGGLLGTPWAVPEVYDVKGNKLESTIVWHNPREGMGVVFTPPDDGRGAWIYLVPAKTVPTRFQTRLRPGLLLFSRILPKATLEEASAMASEWPPGRNSIMRPVTQIGHRDNPIGPEEQNSCWYTGWFRLEQPADIFFATISDDGSEIRLNGNVLVSWPGVHGRQDGAKGQFGKKVALTASWNRLDYLYFNGDSDREANCLWRRGGNDKVFPTTITDKELSRSGRSRLDAIEFQDGRPAARIDGIAAASGYFWYGDKPLLLFQLTADQAGAAAKTEWNWTFGKVTPEGDWKKEDSGQFSGPACSWLQAGETGGSVTLTATADGKETRSTRALTVWSTAPAWSPWDPNQRNAFFAAFLAMGEAKTAGSEPAATWTPAHWETLLGLLDFERRGDLLESLFNHNPKTIQGLPDLLRGRLQLVFIEALLDRSGSAASLSWIDKFAASDTVAERQFFWHAQRVRAWLWKDSDLVATRKAAALLREKAGTPDQIRRALIRQGDVERLAKDEIAAMKFYGEAQTLAKPPEPTDKKGRQARRQASQPEDAAWKSKTIRQGSYPSVIRGLLAQQAIEEAGATLAVWEMEVPLDKLGGDQPLLEALWLEARWQPWAATRLLESVRNREASTRNLPEILVAEIRMLMTQKRTEEAVKVGDELFKKYPSHSVVAEARRLLPLPASMK